MPRNDEVQDVVFRRDEASRVRAGHTLRRMSSLAWLVQGVGILLHYDNVDANRGNIWSFFESRSVYLANREGELAGSFGWWKRK